MSAGREPPPTRGERSETRADSRDPRSFIYQRRRRVPLSSRRALPDKSEKSRESPAPATNTLPSPSPSLRAPRDSPVPREVYRDVRRLGRACQFFLLYARSLCRRRIASIFTIMKVNFAPCLTALVYGRTPLQTPYAEGSLIHIYIMHPSPGRVVDTTLPDGEFNFASEKYRTLKTRGG